MRIILTTLLFLMASAPGLMAQKLTHRLGYLMIQPEKGSSVQHILTEHSARAQGDIRVDRVLSRRLGIYLIRFDHARIHQINLLQQLRRDERVRIAQNDHIPTLRTEPNDPLFNEQWQWLNNAQTGGLPDADIDADEAWNVTQGGVTAAGDTIVVAIVDDGLDYNHEDIAANAWINHHEIDGNGIDDDGNGYIDDIYGWNAYDDNPDVWGQNHGLQVAGMVGAVGNNGTGVSGLNWNVKLMTIVGGTPESAAIASYAYALEQRILYNETNGEKGAFVVATNSSWGVDFGLPSEAPLWCSFYDSLGVHGILSAGATANNDVDIDIVGDLPTACPSEYLLSVTALNHNNDRTFSAFGLTQVDFGAPGENVLTTRRNNNYGTTSGTSFASPVAAGLVALLYSAPCAGFGELIHSNPSAAALYVRDLIFEGVEPLANLTSTTRFGGSLNAGNSIELMMALCSECPVPFAVESDILSDTEVSFTWSMIDTADSINARYRPLGTGEWDTLTNISQPLTLTGLVGCTEYEIEFESLCEDTTSGFQSNHIFKTDGCCVLPTFIEVLPDGDQIEVVWSDVLASAFFIIEWKPVDSTEWHEVAVPGNSFIIEDVLPCTFYEVRMQTNCDTAETEFSETFLLRTRGCGNCIDLPYCEASSADATEEHIDSLIIGSLVNHSGQNGGYLLNETLDPLYVTGDTYSVWIRPGFGTGEKFTEQFRIWLDANQNGEFEENELLLDSTLFEEDTFLIDHIVIPDSALAGSTRMRVSMAFSNPFFPADQEPCGVLEFGEIEDYCVTILRAPEECPAVDTLFFDAVTFTSAFMFWNTAEDAIAYTYRYREAGTTEFTELATVDTTANISDLEKCKTYEFQIRTICPSDTTSYIDTFFLETDCDVAVKDEPALLSSFVVYPNPANDVVILKFQSLQSGIHHISLYDMQGRRMQFFQQYADANAKTQVQIDQLAEYPPGLYFVVIEHGGLSTSRKIVKM